MTPRHLPTRHPHRQQRRRDPLARPARARGVLGLTAALLALHACAAPSPPPEAPTEAETAPRPDAPEGFVRVPAGSFLMGSSTGDPTRGPDERQHRVTLTRDIAVARTELTQEAWFRATGTAPALLAGCATCPVERVSLYDAMAGLNAMSEADDLEPCYLLDDCRGELHAGCRGDKERCWTVHACGRVGFRGLDCEGYRLPTEAEWEYAARAGRAFISLGRNQSRFDDADCAYRDAHTDRAAWTCSNSDDHPQPVASLEPNPWGLYDTRGNVSEWTWAPYTAYPDSPRTDPAFASGSNRFVVRGGHFRSDATRAYPTRRDYRRPEARRSDLGLRPVRTLEPDDWRDADAALVERRAARLPCSTAVDEDADGQPEAITHHRYERIGAVRLEDESGPVDPQLIIRVDADADGTTSRDALLYRSPSVVVTVSGAFSLDHDAGRELRGVPLYTPAALARFDRVETRWVRPRDDRPSSVHTTCARCFNPHPVHKLTWDDEDRLSQRTRHSAWTTQAQRTLTITAHDENGAPAAAHDDSGALVRYVHDDLRRPLRVERDEDADGAPDHITTHTYAAPGATCDDAP